MEKNAVNWFKFFPLIYLYHTQSFRGSQDEFKKISNHKYYKRLEIVASDL